MDQAGLGALGVACAFLAEGGVALSPRSCPGPAFGVIAPVAPTAHWGFGWRRRCWRGWWSWRCWPRRNSGHLKVKAGYECLWWTIAPFLHPPSCVECIHDVLELLHHKLLGRPPDVVIVVTRAPRFPQPPAYHPTFWACKV